MGIVRLSGRAAVRLSTSVREREGRLASIEADRIGLRPRIVPASVVDIVAIASARHSAADRTRVRRDPSSKGEGRRAS